MKKVIKRSVKLNFGEMFHPDTKTESHVRLVPIFGDSIGPDLPIKGHIDLNKVPDCPINAIMGDIEEMDGNKITKFKLKVVSIIPKKVLK